MPFPPTAAARAWAARAALVAALPACAGAQAAPVPLATAPLPPAVSVQIVDRLADSRQAAVADLTGLQVAQAERRLRGQRLRLQAVALRPGARTVRSQWPEPGRPLPDDGTVVVWLGRPAGPPADATETAASDLRDAAAPAPAPVPLAPVSLAPGPSGETASAGLQGGTTPDPSGPPAGGDPTGEVSTGPASWYGPGFDGRRTACGNRFDQDAYTLASRDLACGTTVRVTGPTGRSVTAVVDDWGPAAWTGRRFDLSKATFAAVHHLSAGVTTVTVEVLR